jgi:hypothetical protein
MLGACCRQLAEPPQNRVGNHVRVNAVLAPLDLFLDLDHFLLPAILVHRFPSAGMAVSITWMQSSPNVGNPRNEFAFRLRIWTSGQVPRLGDL